MTFSTWLVPLFGSLASCCFCECVNRCFLRCWTGGIWFESKAISFMFCSLIKLNSLLYCGYPHPQRINPTWPLFQSIPNDEAYEASGVNTVDIDRSRRHEKTWRCPDRCYNNDVLLYHQKKIGKIIIVPINRVAVQMEAVITNPFRLASVSPDNRRPLPNVGQHTPLRQHYDTKKQS